MITRRKFYEGGGSHIKQEFPKSRGSRIRSHPHLSIRCNQNINGFPKHLSTWKVTILSLMRGQASHIQKRSMGARIETLSRSANPCAPNHHQRVSHKNKSCEACPNLKAIIRKNIYLKIIKMALFLIKKA